VRGVPAMHVLAVVAASAWTGALPAAIADRAQLPLTGNDILDPSSIHLELLNLSSHCIDQIGHVSAAALMNF
jgi:hypothetical protein